MSLLDDLKTQRLSEMKVRNPALFALLMKQRHPWPNLLSFVPPFPRAITRTQSLVLAPFGTARLRERSVVLLGSEQLDETSPDEVMPLRSDGKLRYYSYQSEICLGAVVKMGVPERTKLLLWRPSHGRFELIDMGIAKVEGSLGVIDMPPVPTDPTKLSVPSLFFTFAASKAIKRPGAAQAAKLSDRLQRYAALSGETDLAELLTRRLRSSWLARAVATVDPLAALDVVDEPPVSVEALQAWLPERTFTVPRHAQCIVVVSGRRGGVVEVLTPTSVEWLSEDQLRETDNVVELVVSST